MTVIKSQDMKNSGIAWLGDIPSNWSTSRAKYIFRKVQTKPLEDDEVVTAFRNGEVVLRSERREDGFTFSDKEIGYQHVEKGDLVIHAMDAFAGAIGVSKSNGKMSPVCSICKPVRTGTNAIYYAYLLRSMTRTSYLLAIAKGIRERSTDFRYKDFGNMLLPQPDTEAQKHIVGFINEETEKIDNLISKQKKLLELIEEKRRATISYAVTRGLNPSIKLKETNDPWLDLIPVNWSMQKIKYFARRRDEKSEASNGEKYLGLEHAQSFTGKELDTEAQSDPGGLTLAYKENDVLFGKLRPYLAKVLIARESGICSSEFIVLESMRNKILPEYLHFSLLNEQFIQEVNSSTYGAKMPRANWGFIGNVSVPLPTLNEQQKIIDYLKYRQTKDFNIRKKVLLQITLLVERRTSLISHAVTGKIKV